MLDNPKNKKRWKIEFKVVLMVFPIVLSSCTFNVPKNSSSDSSSYYESSTNDNNLYTILWQDDDGTPLEVDEDVPYGILPTYDGSLPTKQGNEEVVYTFSGWSPSISVVTSNQTYTAVYNQSVKTYTVTWQDDDGTPLEVDEDVPYGILPTYDGSLPTKQGNEEVVYTFSGWSPSISVVTSNQTYTAVYNQSHSVEYLFGDNSYSVIGTGMDCENINIPSVYEGYPVTSIGEYAFSNRYHLVSISIPDSITSIDSTSFFACQSLTSINVNENNQFFSSVDGILYNKDKTQLVRYPEGKKTTSFNIPNTVISIADYAFSQCSSLTSISISSSLISIGNYAFLNCESLNFLTIPNGVVQIKNYAFLNCSSLKSVSIPDSVISIGDYVFNGSNRSLIIYAEPMSKLDGWSELWNYECREVIWNSLGSGEYQGLTYIIFKDTLGNPYIEITDCDSSLSAITIPDKIDGISVTSIGDNAFSQCYSLVSISLPDSIITIGNYAFLNCSSLKSVSIPDSVISIGDYVFNGSNRSLIIYAEPMSKLDGWSELWNYECREVIWNSLGSGEYQGLTYIIFKDTLGNPYIEITDCDSSLSAITIPDKIDGISVTSIGDNAFSQCSSLKTMSIPDSVTSIGDNAFSYCSSLLDVSLPKYITIIPDFAFLSCSSLKSVSIPETLNSVGIYAFSQCTSLASITITDGVASIGDNAFSQCTSLVSIIIPNSVTSLGDNAFSGCNSGLKVYAEPTSKPAGWSNLWIPNSDMVIWNSLGSGEYQGLTYIIFKDTLGNPYIEITDCDNSLSTVTIPDEIDGISVTSIGDNAFSQCTSLVSIIIPDSVTSIGYSAFLNCSSLKTVSIPDSVTSIGDYAFSGCISLTSIIIPDSVTSIESYAFSNCESLTYVTIPSSVISVLDNAFSGCNSGLKVYAEPTSKPAGWSNLWISNSDMVIWNSLGSGEYQGLTYIIFKDTLGNPYIEITDCDNSLSTVTIPDEIDGISVTSIGDNTFLYCWSLVSISIPDSIASIETTAFSSCKSLTTINVNENNQFFSSVDGILYNKDKTQLVKYPEGKKTTSFSVPNSVTSIESYAFSNCESLTYVTIPSSVISVLDNAFSGCNSGLKVYAEPTSKPAGWSNLWIPNSDMVIWNSLGSGEYQGLTYIIFKDTLGNPYIEITDCDNSLLTITIPDKIDGISVTSIGDNAFSHCSSLKTMSIPDSVTSIGDNAFSFCSLLKTVSIPDSVITIGTCAFYDCQSLTQIVIPQSVLAIGNSAFSYCVSLASLAVLGNVETIGNNIVSDCGDSLTIYVVQATKPDGWNNLWNSGKAVKWNSRIGIIDGLTYTINQNGTDDNIEIVSFDNASSVINIPNVINNIPVSSISKYAFYNCTSLSSITIPNGVTFIGDCAFAGCTSLTSISVNESNQSFASMDGVLYDKNVTTLICYPANKACDLYCIPNGVTSISKWAFYKCTSLTSVTIPVTMTSISYLAFYYCSSLSLITIPNSVTIICSAAFQRCTSLVSINIPDSVQVIENNAFYGCVSLTSIVIPNSVTSIGYSAFCECISLTSIILSDNITEIVGSTFYDCRSLTSIIIPDKVTLISNNAFEFCSSLTNVVLGSGLKTISSRAFSGCTSLSSITIPNSVTSIGDYAFCACESLTQIIIPQSVINIGSEVFVNCHSLVIYIEVEEKPDGWNSDWNPNNLPIVWNCGN